MTWTINESIRVCGARFARGSCLGLAMTRSPSAIRPGLPRILLLAALACAGPRPDEARPLLHYVGSSTIAGFLRDAEPVYARLRFVIDTEPESFGGLQAILESRCDLAGFAGVPGASVRESGVTVTPLGRDAIAVVVHPSNPVRDLSLEQLAAIFTGRVTSWSELGGPAVPVHPYVVGPASATRGVFRSAVLGEADYAGCEVVRPDAAILDRVRDDPGGIGEISLSFLAARSVAAVRVEGEEASPSNPAYPITRPLNLLWWPGRERVAAFVQWIRTPAGRSVLHERFASP